MVVYNPDGDEVEEVAYGLQGFTSLAGAVATGAGLVLNGGVCRVHHALVVTASAGVTGGVVQLLGSLDAANWFVITSITLTQAGTAAWTGIASAVRPQ